jgi:nucleotide-binding universal stress UspA family protein
LFSDILVPINGKEAGWWALAQAIGVARHEGGRLDGLYVVPNEQAGRSESVRVLQAEFLERCRAAGVEGQLAVDTGGAAQMICDRARWTDLVVLMLSYPPGPHPFTRFRSGFRAMVQHCSRPMLIVTHTPTRLHHALLSYDGSPKCQEALIMATYLSKQWQIALTVLTILDGKRTTEKTMETARDYLAQHGVQANYQTERGAVAASILRTAEQQDCDMIVVGGYGHGPTREIVVGSNVDHLVRQSYLPVLICR